MSRSGRCKLRRNKDAKLSNIAMVVKTISVPWPVDVGKGKSVEVTVPVAINNKQIKRHTEIRLLEKSNTNKRKAATMSVNVSNL